MHAIDRIQLRYLYGILFCCLTALLSACGTQPKKSPRLRPEEVAAIPDATPRIEPRSTRGNPAFYEVLGQRYFVLPSAAGYAERGVASWYGPGFHSEHTSNGERYDMYGMTAAHKTLPLPTYVQVTNLRNGRNVIVRVNDRGPFKAGRIIDLSYTAAVKLDMLRDGTALVEVRALTTAEGSPDRKIDTHAVTDLFMQVGAFSDKNNANALAARLRSQGHTNAFVRENHANKKTIFRVLIGPIPSVKIFDTIHTQLESQGLGDAYLSLD